jgi:tetratricopeptide (TPR) repeat protein
MQFALSRRFVALLVTLFASPVFAQHHHDAAPAMQKGVLLEGLGKLHHPVSTKNAEAQKFFDQGLTLIYAFNHDEAIKSFRKALDLDPSLAMAHWGIAHALGPNYNVPVDAEREKQAFSEINTARDLAAKNDAPQAEKDYIEALAARFSGDEKPDLAKLAQDFAAAMEKLSAKYPDDLDAATLYADAMMNLRPWRLWTSDYKPAEGTEKIVATLESVLKRDPDHIGANHLYIHAVEASATPHRALEAAGRLPTLAPAAGHLVHMPSHIYARIGDWDSASTSNEAAITADESYIKARSPQGVYPLMYYNHNIHFLAYAAEEGGRFADAMAAAHKLAGHAAPHVSEMPMLEAFTVMPMMVLVRFGKWDEVMKLPEPAENMPVTRALWHFSLGFASAARGDTDAAARQRDDLQAAAEKVPADQMFGVINHARAVVAIAQHVLDARLALARGQQDQAEQHMKQAVAAEDALAYIEPPDWLHPGREAMGMTYLSAKQFDKAEAAFRDQLDRTPRSGRSLYGLWKSLEAQNKTYDAQWIKRQFDAAWKGADTKMAD